MCLQVKRNAERKVAKKDITCYKVLLTKPDGSLRTPYRDVYAEIGETYTSRLQTPTIDNEISVGLHSFVTLKAAKRELIDWEENTVTVVKCIIPKDAEYYRGGFNSEDDAYASNELKYVEIKKVVYPK